MDLQQEMKPGCKLVSVTPDAEQHIAYCARVKLNPSNQNNEKFSGLLKYCIKNQHWSIFEQAFMTLEITTNRGIAARYCFHRSFTFQEFSQRYAPTSFLGEIELPELRRQDDKNRQNSIDDLDPEIVEKLNRQMITLFSSANNLYKQMLDHGVAKECQKCIAGFVLNPLYTHQDVHDRICSVGMVTVVDNFITSS